MLVATKTLVDQFVVESDVLVPAITLKLANFLEVMSTIYEFENLLSVHELAARLELAISCVRSRRPTLRT